MRRSEMREQAFILVFESLFYKNLDLKAAKSLYKESPIEISDYAVKVYMGARENMKSFDELINTYSKSWSAKRMPKVTRAVLYVALYEMSFEEGIGDGVAINEAVELAKKYATPKDASYINGILGAISRSKDVSRN